MSERTTERTTEMPLEAERNRADHGPITEEPPGLDLAGAYRTRNALLERDLGSESVAGV